MMNRNFTRASLIATTILLAACSGDRAAAETDTALEKAAEALTSVRDSVAGRLAGREYTNAEMVAVVNAYNDAEIEVGQLGETKATDTTVRNFARQLVAEHRALKTEVSAAAQRLNVTAAMPTDDENLTEDHQAGMRDLNAKAKGRDFDEAFLEHEIKMHKNVLDRVEDALAGERNQEIRSVLERARNGLRAHLTRAEELEKKFGAA